MKQLAFARHLRHGQTDCETRLWRHLRAHRLFGLMFRRQQPVGDYVVDCFCSEHRLVVELDGGQHWDLADYDEGRDAWLCEQGYVVLRYWNNDVLGNLDGVLEDIARRAGVLGEGRTAVVPADGVTPPSPQPLSPQGRGAEPKSDGFDSPPPSRGRGRGRGGNRQP